MASFKSEQHLLEAIEKCQLHKIIQLVKQGRNIHIRNTLGQNFLVYILQQQEDSLLSKKRFQMFQFLITNYNLNIHSFDHHGKNIFNWATNLNCTKEALYLLNSNPGDLDILVRDQTGSCSLHYAVEHGNDILVHAIINYLLRYRLRFDIKDAHNNTPEDLARKLGYEKIAHFLSEACRSTVFMSREIPLTSKPKTIPSSLSDLTEYFNSIEARIDAAKSLDDWKTVAALRASKINLNEKNSNKTRKYFNHILNKYSSTF
jgi:ankyrin repeat protein